MKRTFFLGIALVAALALGGCAVYEPVAAYPAYPAYGYPAYAYPAYPAYPAFGGVVVRGGYFHHWR